MKTVKFYTLGCKVNQYDTQDIREQFLNCGFREIKNARPADICVVNTCTVTHKADSESLGYVRHARKENPGARIIVTGCLAELDGARARKEGADLIVRNKDKQRLLQILSLRSLIRRIVNPPNNQGISNFEGRTRAFLKIQDGCDNLCSYCKVPLVRGRSTSRPLAEIAEEAKRLVKNGYKEIVLTGICLGSYEPSLVDAISELEKIDGLLRIRLSSIEAGDVTDALIDKISSSAKLCPHLHIPIQSGDDTILKRMNRRYTNSAYRRLIEKIKKRVPDIAITTDVLAGFPGEREKNFNNTMRLLKEMMPLKVHIFPYSAREGTAAARFAGRPGQEEIKKRTCRLKEISDTCGLKYKKKFLNKILSVLMESPSKNKRGFWEGHSANYIKVLVRSKKDLANKLIPLKVKKISNEYARGYFY